MAFAVVSYSDADGQHTVVLERASTSLGRSPGRDVLLRDPLVSRQHAAIVRDEGSYIVVDEGSTHGTFVNGARVQRARLRSGDVVQLGSLKGLRIHFRIDGDETLTSRPHPSAANLLSSLRSLVQPDGDALPAERGLEQLNWLMQAARQLNESGAMEDILRALLQLTLQLTGLERGFVYLREGEEMRFAQGLRADGEPVQQDGTISHSAMRKAIESKRKFTVSDTLADDRASKWSSVMANQIRSICCIPLRQRVSAQEAGQLLGVLYLDSQARPGFLTEVDHQLLDTIAIEAAALLQNVLLAEAEFKARQAREELAVAAKIHSGLMAVALPRLAYAEIQARSIPCLEIGGDFYDVVALDDCVYLTIVDVSGKGIPAAIVAATLQGIIHAQFLARQPLAEIAAMVNRFLCSRDVGKYATMILVRLASDGAIEYLNCGHVQPLAILGTEVRQLAETNLIVGLIPDAVYLPARDALRADERLLLATDGVTEAENQAGELFGYDGLSTAAQRGKMEAILDRVAQFQGGLHGADDCTLLDVSFGSRW